MLDAIGTLPVVSALGWAVLHFPWQGCVIAGLAALAFSGLRERSAQSRYVIGCIALACSLLTFAMTFTVALPLEGAWTHVLPAILHITESSTSASGIDVVASVVAVVPVIALL